MKRIGRLRTCGLVGCLVATVAALLAAGGVVRAADAGAGENVAKESAKMDARESVRLSRAGTFEIHVQGADLRGVLQLLSTQGKKNIVATKDVTGTVTADLYSVTFIEALDAVMKSSGFVYEEKGNFVYVYTAQQLADIRKAERKLEYKVFNLSYMTAKDAQAIIAPALSPEGTSALTPAAMTGIATSPTDAGGNSYATGDVLVVRDYEENVKRVAEILAKLDVRPDQVLIEATILKASLDEGNDLGIDFNTLAGIDFQALGSTTSGGTSMDPEVSTTFDGKSGATFKTDVSAAVPTGGLTIGVITDQVAVFIRALETVTDTTIVANPKVPVLNKQRAEIMIGKRSGYLTTNVTETMTTQTVEFLETGTRLVVRPYIAKDGYIRMEIHPEDSDGGVAASGLPTETTTETTTNVLIRDGHTLVIGGLFREKTINGRSQVPLLGNIPHLGALFGSTSDTTEREEVIILVTPHIIRHEVDEAVAEQAKDDVERYRIGQRTGLRWWGRGPLAQTHMRWAKEELANGDRAKALWNIDMALSLSPRMEEAIRLKERLTEKAYWADESRVSSAKYLIQQMIMQELGKPVERIVPPDKPRDADKVESDVRKALGISKRYEDPIPGMGTGLVGVQTTTRPAGADTHSPAPDKPAAPTKKPTTRPTTRPDQAKTNVVEPKTTQ